jgi:hypothetical protein
MAKTVMNYSDSVSFKLRQIFDLTGVLEENLATWVNLSILARNVATNSYISRYPI